jgi:hypothetical protein
MDDDTGCLASPDSAQGLRTRGVRDTDESEERKVFLGELTGDFVGLLSRDLPMGETDDAQSSRCEAFILGHEVLTNVRCQWSGLQWLGFRVW